MARFDMENTSGLECKCVNCGTLIHYAAEKAGTDLTCPKCKAELQLPGPAPTNPPEQSPTPASTAPKAPPQKERLRLGANRFQDEKPRQPKRRLVIIFASGAILLLGLVGGFIWKRPQNRMVQPTGMLPQPKVKRPKSYDDLRVSRFALARERDNPVRLITGEVQNISDNVHLDVTLYLDVLDARGEKISEIRETIVELAPNATWRVITRTENTNAISARFNRFGERF